MATEFEYLWKRRHDALYTVRMNRMYYRKREKFFEVCDRSIKAFSIIASSAALYRATNADSMSAILLGVVALNAVSLVFGLAERALRSSKLATDYAAIEASIASAGERAFTEADVTKWDADMSALGAHDPAGLRTLLLMVQNELDASMGKPVDHIPLLRRMTAHIA